jgi:hypothetical protein
MQMASLHHVFFSFVFISAAAAVTMACRTVADEVCSMDEAQLLYPQLGLLANLGLVGSGRFIKAVHAAVGPAGGMGAVLQVMVVCGEGGPGRGVCSSMPRVMGLTMAWLLCSGSGCRCICCLLDGVHAGAT